MNLKKYGLVHTTWVYPTEGVDPPSIDSVWANCEAEHTEGPSYTDAAVSCFLCILLMSET